MPSLRDYRDRIKSVKSTKKITSAMKMVAASKLRRAQEQAEAAQPYAHAMAEVLSRVAKNVQLSEVDSKLLTGTGKDQKYLLIIVSADRGLCGGFNTHIIKAARQAISGLLQAGKDVSIITVGKKIRDVMRREYNPYLWKSYVEMTGKRRVEYADANEITQYVLEHFEDDTFDVCQLIFNEFESVLIQKPVAHQLIPFNLPDEEDDRLVPTEEGQAPYKKQSDEGYQSTYSFEPSEEEILSELLPKNIGIQIFSALLDSAAGEQAARMTAMDNATRNAGDMIDDLTLDYNRARQAYITKELIEIISGAEAL